MHEEAPAVPVLLLLPEAHLFGEIAEALLVLRLGDRACFQKLIQQRFLLQIQLFILFLRCVIVHSIYAFIVCCCAFALSSSKCVLIILLPAYIKY